MSLLPIFQGQQRDAHEWLFWEHNDKKAARHGDWKLIGRDNPNDPANWELFNLESDRTELRDVAEKEQQRVKQMAQAWWDWAERTNG